MPAPLTTGPARRPLLLRVESIDIARDLAAREAEPGPFVDAVKRDLTRRRDLYTPIAPGTPAAVTAEIVRRRQAAWRERARGDGPAAPAPDSGGL